MIGLVVMMLGVGSWAVFNDTESAGPYTATAGSLDLEMNAPATASAEIGDLKPSVWHYLGPFELRNVGANPGVLDLHFMNVVDSGGVLTEPEEAEEYAGAIDDISNWIDVDWCIDGTLDGLRGCNGTDIGKLGQIESMVIDLETTLQPSVPVELWLSFHLQYEAGNEYQGDKSCFEVVVTMHQPGVAAGATTVRLENKDTTTWAPILDDDLYGSVTYYVGSGLNLDVELHGLAPSTYHQLALNGPDGTSACEATDNQLASGSELYANYDSGFWDGSGPNINQGTCASPNNEGIYNFAYVQTDALGNWLGTIVVANSGEADPADAGKVTAANPALPVGIYSGVKFIVKEVTDPLPGTAWTPELMEMQPLNFNLP
jgi:predicted ribosomally synthesized peptide with SipW-like signal peptide